MRVKTKIITLVVLLSAGLLAKYILWDFAVSTGKRTGNLVKLSDKGKILKTWEGTMDLGSGDKLTFDFSVKSEAIATEMYEYTGSRVSIHYEEHILGWPRETKYDVVGWRPVGGSLDDSREKIISGSSDHPEPSESEAMNLLNKTLFCSLLGSVYSDQELYKKLKSHLKSNNLYLYRQIEKCNE